jgi:hypothetical protein
MYQILLYAFTAELCTCETIIRGGGGRGALQQARVDTSQTSIATREWLLSHSTARVSSSCSYMLITRVDMKTTKFMPKLISLSGPL